MGAMPTHRRVLFLAGFDPKSPRYYHHLYRDLAAQHPGSTPATRAQVGPRRPRNAWSDEWEVAWGTDASRCQTRFTQVRWDDVVREHWARGTRGMWLAPLNFYLDGARQGFFGRAWRASRVNWMSVMYPLAAALVVTGVWAAAALWGWALSTHIDAEHQAAWAWVLGVSATAGAWFSWQWVSHRIGADWLMRLYAFSHAQAAGGLASLEARVDAMAGLIVQTARDEPGLREILVVGHSVGATLAASAVSRALAQAPWLGRQGPELALLTLGHCTPLVSYFGTATRFRHELGRLTTHAQLTWVDYTAPADWAGCGRITPWLDAGTANLHRLSPRFPKILKPDHYRALRRNRLLMHMQYLRPPDHAGSYDLLAMTAGTATLRERHPARPDGARPTLSE
jgi:hypothetical protein